MSKIAYFSVTVLHCQLSDGKGYRFVDLLAVELQFDHKMYTQTLKKVNKF